MWCGHCPPATGRLASNFISFLVESAGEGNIFRDQKATLHLNGPHKP